MMAFRKHIHAAAAVLALTFSLAGSGFAVILHQCTAPAVSCCSTDTPPNHCESTDLQPTTLSFRSSEICHTNTMVGGLTTNPAVVEKAQKGTQKKTETLPVLTSLVSHSSLLAAQAPAASLLAVRPSLPSVEKHVLFQTFLI